MKRIGVLISLCMMVFLAYGQKDRTAYVIVDETFRDLIIDKAAEKYSNGDAMEKLSLTSMLREGFDKYFKDGKVSKVSVFPPDSLVRLHERIRTLKEANGKLTKNHYAKVLADSTNAWNAKDQASRAMKENTLRAWNDSINRLNALLAQVGKENDSFSQQVSALSSKTKILDGISSDLTEKQKKFNSAYEYSKHPLSEITKTDAMKDAVTSYEESLKALRQTLTPEQQKQKAEILGCANVAGYYQKAMQQLSGRYDKKAVAEILKVAPNTKGLDGDKLREIEEIQKRLRNEIYVLKNFRNAILGSLKDMGSIKDDADRNKALEIISENVDVFSMNDASRAKDGYNIKYGFINGKLNELRNAVRNYRTNRFTDGKTFITYLDKISTDLGDSVN